ncbi:MAG: hypothetical protein AAGD05_11165, partial [Bacteroidota bacterium]
GSTTQFDWTPADFLDNSNIAGPTATLTVGNDIQYNLTATSASGFCSQEDSVRIMILPAEVSILEGDTAFICLGDSVSLNANTSTGGIGLNWSPNDSISSTVGLSVVVNPTVSTWYFASLSVGPCSVLDSIFVKVDSLPDLAVDSDPFKETYCSGEIVTLTSPIFDPDDYPDIEHLWRPRMGQETDSTFFNLVVTTFDTITYVRTTINNACVDSASITLDVIPPLEFEITPDTSICEGESVQLNVSNRFDPNVTYTWSPEESLSCTECPDPLATPPSSVNYSVMAVLEGPDCPGSTGMSITVITEPELDLPEDPIICQGESITLNNLIDPDATYTWTSTDPDFGVVNDPAPMVSPDTTHTYFVTMTKTACEVLVAEVTVDVIINILSITSDTTVCARTDAPLNVVSTFPDASFQWSPSTGLSCTDCPNPIANVSDTIQYTVTVDANGCSTTATVNVFAEAEPQLGLPADTSLCVGASLNLNSLVVPGATYTWTTDDPNFGDPNDPSPTIMPDSTYTYSVVMSKAFCEDIQEEVRVELIINELTITPDVSICSGDEIDLLVSSTYPDASFQWSPATALSCTDCPNPTSNARDTIQYTVVADAEGCLSSEVVNVFVTQLPEVDLPAQSILCFNDNMIVLNSLTADPAATYTWSSSNTPFTSLDPTPTDFPDQSTTYTLTLEKQGCTSIFEGVVEVIESATLSVLDNDIEVCLNDLVQLEAIVDLPSSQDIFSWSPDLEDEQIVDFTATDPGNSTYFVELNNTCQTLSDSVNVFVATPELVATDSIILPEPNGDCYNEGEQFTIEVRTDGAQDNSTVSWTQNGAPIGTGRAIEVQLGSETTAEFQVDIVTENNCTSSA